MIKKSILVFVVLSAFYSAFLYIINPSWNTIQNQWQENNIVIEEYLIKDVSPEKVVLGSSMAARLIDTDLPELYNLALNGMTIYDGGEILSMREQLPKVVFIETNMWRGDSKPSLLDDATSPMRVLSSKYFIVSRRRYQPVGVFGYGLVLIINKVGYEIQKIFERKEDSISIDNSFNQKEPGKILIEEHLTEKKFAKEEVKPDKEYINQYKKFETLVNFFLSNNVKVVLFEMPIGSEFCNAGYYHFFRKQVLNDFLGKVSFLDMPICGDESNYPLSDRIHLNHEGATNYTSFFKQEIEILPSKDFGELGPIWKRYLK